MQFKELSDAIRLASKRLAQAGLEMFAGKQQVRGNCLRHACICCGMPSKSCNAAAVSSRRGLPAKALSAACPCLLVQAAAVAALEALSAHAFNGGMAAYRAGVLEPCVMLLSTSCVLFKELDAARGGASKGGSSGLHQARALLAASQALLDLHSLGATSERCADGLGLAVGRKA